MKIKEYAALRQKYRMPQPVGAAGNAVDQKTGAYLSIGIVVHRDTYQKTGYLCHEEATDGFHACVCSLLEQIQDMPIIKTVLLTPDMVWAPLCEGEEPPEEIKYASTMALCALREALRGHLAIRQSIAEKQGEEG